MALSSQDNLNQDCRGRMLTVAVSQDHKGKGKGGEWALMLARACPGVQLNVGSYQSQVLQSW